jgi:hypothetical protein
MACQEVEQIEISQELFKILLNRYSEAMGINIDIGFSQYER